MKSAFKTVFTLTFIWLSFATSNFAQCVELGTVSQLSPVVKSIIGFCPATAQAASICDCPTGFVAVGYEGEEGNGYGPMVLSQFTLRCKALNSNGTLGATVMVTCSNGTATGTLNDGPIDAAAGEVLVGAEMRIGCAVDAVMGESKSLADVIAGLPNTVSNSMTGIGGTAGAPQPVMYAPAGSVIVGMQTYIDPGNTPAFANGICAGVAWRYAPIVNCPAVCSVDGISTSNISACNDNGTLTDPSDDTYTADVTVTFTDAPASGTLDISGDGSASVAVGSLGAGSHTFNSVSMSADGGSISLTATFSADGACTLSNTNAGTAPASCSNGLICSISSISTLNHTACDNNGTPSFAGDDTFTADIIVNFSNAPATGTLDVSGDGSASIAVGSLGAGTHTFNGVTMTADGAAINLIATFSADGTCTLNNASAGFAPASCSSVIPPSGAIPTMSEWGLILFSLIIFTLSVVFGTLHQHKLATEKGTQSFSARTKWSLPFDKATFFKVLPFVYLGFFMVFAIAMTLFAYELTNADIPGSLLSGMVIAYLIQFVKKSTKENS